MVVNWRCECTEDKRHAGCAKTFDVISHEDHRSDLRDMDAVHPYLFVQK